MSKIHLDIQITWNDTILTRHVPHFICTSPLSFAMLPESPGGLFTDSQEHECHNALKSLISLPSCHLAPPRALPLCLPVGFAVCLDVCLSVSLSEGLSKLCFSPAITAFISLCISWQVGMWPRAHTLGNTTHTHINQDFLYENFSTRRQALLSRKAAGSTNVNRGVIWQNTDSGCVTDQCGHYPHLLEMRTQNEPLILTYMYQKRTDAGGNKA